MIHYSCDMCGCSIPERRYVARIEVAAMFDPDELTEADLDTDHLEQIAETLAAMESTADFELEETGPKQMQFDLCSNCARRYLQNPLGPKRSMGRPKYSQN
ncbi:MAG TPA: hypothetical protein VNQ76_04420 [Planctomicrobium sp.]|nr:hypothetical protein [Planctomicrobium sp.]